MSVIDIFCGLIDLNDQELKIYFPCLRVSDSKHRKVRDKKCSLPCCKMSVTQHAGCQWKAYFANEICTEHD